MPSESQEEWLRLRNKLRKAWHNYETTDLDEQRPKQRIERLMWYTWYKYEHL